MVEPEWLQNLGSRFVLHGTSRVRRASGVTILSRKPRLITITNSEVLNVPKIQADGSNSFLHMRCINNERGRVVELDNSVTCANLAMYIESCPYEFI